MDFEVFRGWQGKIGSMDYLNHYYDCPSYQKNKLRSNFNSRGGFFDFSTSSALFFGFSEEVLGVLERSGRLIGTNPPILVPVSRRGADLCPNK